MTVADMRALPEYKVLLHRKYTVLLLHWEKKVQPASYSAWISSIRRNWFSVDIGLRCDRWQLPPQFVLILYRIEILFVSVYKWPWNLNQIRNFVQFSFSNCLMTFNYIFFYKINSYWSVTDQPYISNFRLFSSRKKIIRFAADIIPTMILKADLIETAVAA